MKNKILKAALIILVASLTGLQLFSQDGERIEKSTRIAYDRQPSFIFITEIAGGPGLSLTDAPLAKYYAGVNTLAGYQFSGNIKAGAGIGLHFHNEGTFLPLLLDARFSLNAADLVPYFSARGGIALNLSDRDDLTWLFINPALGIRWVAADRRAFSFSAGLMTLAGSLNRNSYINFRLGLELKGK